MKVKCEICKSNNMERDFVTVIVKVVDYCNFECDFCRYYLNQNRKKMSLNVVTFKKIIHKACEYNISRDMRHLTVIFHGGEPLLWGIENFKSAMDIEKEFEQKYDGFRFINNIQTNGSLINDEWAVFFNDYNFSIGISIDGPDMINFHKNSAISENVVLNNIRLLSEHNCKYGILSVITEKHKGHADDYYDFLVRNEIHSVGFCYCFDSEGEDVVKNETLTSFLIRFFDLYFNGNYKLHVREFEYVMKLCFGIRIEGCTFDFRRSCGNYFSVRPNGDICFCDSYNLQEEALGNILEDDFEIIKKSQRLADILVDVRLTGDNACNMCEIKEICGGGCARHVFPNGEHAFCDTYKVLYPYIYEKVKGVR